MSRTRTFRRAIWHNTWAGRKNTEEFEVEYSAALYRRHRSALRRVRRFTALTTTAVLLGLELLLWWGFKWLS